MEDAKPLIVTDSNFNEIIRNNSFVIIDVWAEWCSPCQMVAPVVEELASEYAKKVTFGKLNVDENPGVPSQYGIMSIPTLLFFKKGELVDTIIGAVPKSYLKSKIQAHLE